MIEGQPTLIPLTDSKTREILDGFGIEYPTIRKFVPGVGIEPLADSMKIPWGYHISEDLISSISALIESGQNLPNIVLVHVRGTEDTENSLGYKPDRSGDVILNAACAYYGYFKSHYPTTHLNYVVAGDHRDERRGTSISEIYMDELYRKLQSSFRNSGGLSIFSQCGRHTRGRKGAHDSLGELDYLQEVVNDQWHNPTSLTISVAPHVPYLRLINRSERVFPISAEGLLCWIDREIGSTRYEDLLRAEIGFIKNHGNLNASYLIQCARMEISMQRRLQLLGHSLNPINRFATRAVSIESGLATITKRFILQRGRQFARAMLNDIISSNEILRRNGGL